VNGNEVRFDKYVTLTLQGLQPNSEVRIYRKSDMTELGGVENSENSFDYNYTWTADVDVVISIFNLNYKPIRMEITLTKNDTELPIKQVYDRNYKNP